MTSQVYYRRWRPRSFAELVGQEHVAATLQQSVRQDRVSHSYLFCGPRGSGKTTTARIIAKAVNCLDLQDGDPCNSCTICQAINDGRFMDIIELDAASNRGIDEIREIREKVNFSPAQGNRKVYIIDEAHMLTDAAANAFLKTLEEPPSHVIFVLCTTEYHKILPTIVSRCQHFDFRRIPSELICRRLTEMVEAEGAIVEAEALRLVARYASGSLRDAQNLLEQLVLSSSDGVGLSQVEDMLGLGHGERWLDLVKHLLTGNTSAALGVINQAAWDGIDLRQLHRQTQELLRAVLHLQWNSGQSLDLADHVVNQLGELVGQLQPWKILKGLKTWGEVNVRYDASSTLPLELAAVEICEAQVAPPADITTTVPPELVDARPPLIPRAKSAAKTPALEGAGSKEAKPAVPVAAQPQPSANPAAAVQPPDIPSVDKTPVAPSGAVPVAAQPQPSANPAAAVQPPDIPSVDKTPVAPSGTEPSGLFEAWTTTVKTLARQKGKKYFLGALLKDCRPEAIYLDGNTLVLPFAHRTHMERMQEEIDDPKGRGLVSGVISQCFAGSYEVKLTLDEGAGSTDGTPPVSAQNSPLVRAAMGMGARIVKEVSE